jgi:hypothetical protein
MDERTVDLGDEERRPARSEAYQRYVDAEIQRHATKDHAFEADAEDDVEGHMPKCKKC